MKMSRLGDGEPGLETSLPLGWTLASAAAAGRTLGACVRRAGSRFPCGEKGRALGPLCIRWGGSDTLCQFISGPYIQAGFAAQEEKKERNREKQPYPMSPQPSG